MSGSGVLGDLQALSVAVDGGQLRLNGDAANRCAEACARYADGLSRLKGQGRHLVRWEAFGDLASAQQLGKKFSDLATGGEGSFEQVIQQHIDVAMKMQDVFINAGAAYRQTEDSNAGALGSIGSDL
ncbi:hypothetical protein [Rhodococcus sp. NPDC058521]|uniref:hypothetical protein n=1 Tax=Rhodococcus sp. NPDC058521 TaxID=3346536 RepID=UPI0036517EFD